MSTPEAAAHKVVLPPAEKYGTGRFRINGGVVDAGNGAGFLTISNNDQPLGSLQATSPRGGWHLRATRRANAMVWRDRAIYWMVNCGYGHRYDVTRAEVTLR